MKNKYYLGTEQVSKQVYETIQMYKNYAKALNIIKKYLKVIYTEDDLFLYGFEDKQYASLRSSNIMTKEEYDFLKEVLND